jgi:hypothetical protein
MELGISQSLYSRLERRVRWVGGPAAQRIMDVTGVPLEVIAGVSL